MWSEDGLGTPDSVLGRAGWKDALRRLTGDENMFVAPQKPLEDATRDALTALCTILEVGYNFSGYDPARTRHLGKLKRSSKKNFSISMCC
jgi:hypothetical protein